MLTTVQGGEQSPPNKQPLSNFQFEDIEMQNIKTQQVVPTIQTNQVISPSQQNLKVEEDAAAAPQKKHKSSLPLTALFRFATRQDWAMMIIGSIAALLNGLSFPSFSLVFGQMIDSFGPTSTGDDLVSAAGTQCIYFAIIGVASFFLSWIQLGCWMITGERQSIEFRKHYFNAIVNQEIGWFDQINPNELSSKIASECAHIQEAIGEKVATYLMSISTAIGGFAVGYTRGWQMALVSTAALPVIILGAACYTLVMQKSQKAISGSYETAGGLAEQSLNAIKTIKSLTGEEFELTVYTRSLNDAFKIACRYGGLAGAGMGLMLLTMFCDYALSFWYGSQLISEGVTNQIYDRNYTQGDVYVIFFSVLIGGFSFAQIGPCLSSFEIGKESAEKIFIIMDRVPTIQMPKDPKTIPNIQGDIILKDVEFRYPAKKDILVHKKLSLRIQPNKKTALVGESGCGKSTVMQLLLRFYDPEQGSVTIDGYDVKTLDFRWLRNNVGYVGQEPVLFATTIRENLKFGKESATEEEMIAALKQANAWEFVSQLENQLDTFVGNAGSQISGGQKQRICIARAILKNPQILLLDEATSALDRKNEAMIQKTLDEISKGRTTIVIAHRLTTIKNADEILVIDHGKLIEQGSYEKLIEARGKFEALAKNQMQKEQKDDEERKHQEELQKEDQEEKSERLRQSTQRRASSVYQNALTREEQAALEEQEKQAYFKQLEKNMWTRLFTLNKPERPQFIFGIIYTALSGACFPLCGLILGEFISVLSDPHASNFDSKRSLLSIYFIIIGVAGFFLNVLKYYYFTRVGEGLTMRVRQELLKKMFNMPGGWFDRNDNNPGTLSARLASDAHLINNLTSTIVQVQVFNFATFLTGFVIAFVYSWRVALVAIAVCPFVVVSGTIRAKKTQGFSEGSDKAYKDSGVIIMEAVTNIRTVASFANEKKLGQFLDQTLVEPYSIAFRKGHISGVLLGFSQIGIFAVYAVIFICSAVFVRDYGVTPREMFVSIFAVLNAATSAGNNNHFMGDVGAAKAACKEIFRIIDSPDEEQLQQKRRAELNIDSKPLVINKIKGDIEFRNVSFKYPTRDAIVFRHLSFKVNAGQKVAFVGPSGSGKSSVLQLLLRFYDNYEGQILVDGEDIRNYDIKEFRKNFGVVSQEPTLFQGTIADNIKYNTPDVGPKEIREAAQKANALSFIEEKQDGDNTDGFQKQVGLKGSQISGGQKQRIAIARAVIKNPNVMLLDEATSALDHENEKIVQEALNLVMKGKTSLVIAHRLSTIVDSDQIFVIEGGRLVEQGTFEELMSKRQFFYRLNNS